MNKERFQGMIAGIAVTALIAGFSASAFAANRSITVSDGIRVVLNGQTFQPKDGNGAPVDLFSYNGTIYAPVRAICEAAGMDVSYDSKTQTATITAAGKTQASSQPAAESQQTDSALIDEEAAKKAALDHAKVSAENAVFTEMKLSKGFGTAHYDLEFHSGNTEYEYEIDAITGRVLKFEQSYQDHYQVQKTTSGTISAERAKEIALQRAPGATITKCELDTDDGLRIYELDLKSGFTKYECEIDASTGDVLKWEVDD